MNDAKYIGMDVHQATISAAVRDSRGNLVMEAILETKAETILQFIGGLRGSSYVAFEEGTWAASSRRSCLFLDYPFYRGGLSGSTQHPGRT
jgi:hypothetical protein